MVKMKRKIFTVLFSVLLLTVSCKEKISYEERDEILKKAFAEIASGSDSIIIKGLRTIRKYPTHQGLQNTISLWETDVSDKVEREIIRTLKANEMFRKDDSLIEEIFDRNFDPETSKSRNLKLKKLISSSDVDIKGELLKRIDATVNRDR